MSSNGSDSGYSPTDIITYIGVPLAVLGVLPILYNTVATLAALQKIKRMLRHSKLPALTRSDVVNRVIEVELPRYAVTPLDRFNERADYWQLSRQPSQIPGGTWTTFNWKTNTIGLKTQRVEYADQLRQPQVEVAFDELVAYLLDLGAVPVAHGWKLLRSTGLWTPRGCALMESPDGHKALTIGPLDDSDGHLSLAVTWSSTWTTRDFSSLPPYWVRLPPPPPQRLAASTHSEAGSTSQANTIEEAEEEPTKETERKVDSVHRESLDSIQKQAKLNSTKSITCQISVDGLVAALSQESEIMSASSNPHSLYTEHLRIRAGKLDGVWFASAATAYGTSSQTVLWNYKIPDEILNFARRDTVPCGVLVLLGVVDESETPEWATKYDSGAEHELFFRQCEERRLAQAEEDRMSPAQRQIAISNRMKRESNQRMQDMRDKMRIDRERRETRASEALQSPKWDTKLVAERNLAWLRGRGHVGEEVSGLKDAVGALLHRMVLDGQFTTSLARILGTWKAWADNGGMRKSDYAALEADQVVFAQASLLVAMIKESTGAHEGTLSVDLQECLRMWRTVRLG
ncbi:hypothetical protein BX600DRAFT_380781 [Xylariales sp. PMI_506]|nr:hypothetical protein BX600DRAFT_380781 [Xylariales sp. PMI_506]